MEGERLDRGNVGEGKKRRKELLITMEIFRVFDSRLAIRHREMNPGERTKELSILHLSDL